MIAENVGHKQRCFPTSALFLAQI